MKLKSFFYIERFDVFRVVASVSEAIWFWIASACLPRKDTIKCILIIFILFFMSSSSLLAQSQEPPAEETEQLDFAQGLLERGLYDMASSEYQKFIAAYPKSAYLEEAYLAIGESYFLSQNFPKAIDAFNDFKKRFPDSNKYPSALLRLGQIYIQQKNFDQAIAELTSIDPSARVKGDSLQSFYFYLAKAYREKNDSAKALEFFQKASQVTDAAAYKTYAYEYTAEIQIQNNKLDDAVQSYLKAIESASDNQLKSYLVYKLGETYFINHQYAEAVGQFHQVLSQYPDSEVRKEAVANLLSAYVNLDQFDQVLSEYRTNASIIKEDGDYAAIHLTAASALEELQKFDEAVALLDKISAFPNLKDSDKRKVLLRKTDILIKQKKFKDAITLVDNPLPGQADDADEVSFLKAQGYFGLGDFEKASGFFEDVSVHYAGSQYAQASLLGQAHAKRESGKYQEARDLFVKYTQLEKDEALRGEAFYYAAFMNVQLNAYPDAISQAQDYLKTFPNGNYYEASVLLLADLYIRTNQAQKAADLLNDYLSHPEKIQKMDAVDFFLGYSQQILGQTDQAIETYKKTPLNKDDPKYYAFGLKNTAAIFLSQGKEAQAADVFNQLINQTDVNFLELKTFYWVCEQFLKDKKYNDVLKIVERIEKYFPNEGADEKAYFKAESYRGLNDLQNAVKFYDAVLSSSSKNMYTGSAHIGKGLTLLELKKTDEAKAEFQHALDENADDNTITLRARFELARIADGQNDKEAALKFYLLIGTVYDDQTYVPQSLLRAVEILESQNRQGEAIKIYQDIISQYPDSAQAQAAKTKMVAK